VFSGFKIAFRFFLVVVLVVAAHGLTCTRTRCATGSAGLPELTGLNPANMSDRLELLAASRLMHDEEQRRLRTASPARRGELAATTTSTNASSSSGRFSPTATNGVRWRGGACRGRLVVERRKWVSGPGTRFSVSFAAGPPGPAAALTRKRCSTPEPRDSADPQLLTWQRPRAGAAAHTGPATAAPARSRSRRNASPGRWPCCAVAAT